nr:MerR family transcriptional regulator [Patulibacter sp. SYSU D01012]
MHRIGEVAERVGLSLRTVRYYEEQGLVVPATRTDGGFRLYADEQIDRLRLIKATKPLGFSLDETRELLAARDAHGAPDAEAGDRTAAAERLRAFADEVERRRAKLLDRIAQSATLAAELRAEAAAPRR